MPGKCRCRCECEMQMVGYKAQSSIVTSLTFRGDDGCVWLVGLVGCVVWTLTLRDGLVG